LAISLHGCTVKTVLFDRRFVQLDEQMRHYRVPQGMLNPVSMAQAASKD
jgi:hypothetical protein